MEVETFAIKKQLKKIYRGVPRSPELGQNPKKLKKCIPKTSYCLFVSISLYGMITPI
jgi:hypothetical protein